MFDRFGNPWSGVKVSVVLVPIGGSKGHFMRGSVIHAKTINGVATFSKLVIGARGRYVLRAVLGRQRGEIPRIRHRRSFHAVMSTTVAQCQATGRWWSRFCPALDGSTRAARETDAPGAAHAKDAVPSE